MIMRRGDVKEFADWFARHVDGFLTACGEAGRAAIRRKDLHTRSVVTTMRQIGMELGLAEEEMLLAETVAWFHDIGRFTQWKRYGTFSDSKSEDHALLGLKVLRANRVLERLSETEREIVEGAIEHHGKRRLPPALPDRVAHYAKMLRDADKLDIWRQLVEFKPGENAANDNVVTYGLPPSPSYSERIMNDLLQGRSSDYHYARTQTDAILLRLGWVFDLNFDVSRRLTVERRYVETLVAGLPNTTEVETLKARLLHHVGKTK